MASSPCSCGCFVVILVLLHFGPDLIALALAGSRSHLPWPVGPAQLLRLLTVNSFKRELFVGGTDFAKSTSYSHGTDLSEQQLAEFKREGYVVLRGVVPKATITALRLELVKSYSFEFEKNGHLEEGNAVLLDFLTLGPLASIAAQLLETHPVHLLRSVHHFRPTLLPFQRIEQWHYDWLECEEDLPVRGSGAMLVKFNVALYDDMPAMWLVNESAFEAAAVRHMGEAGANALLAGPRGPLLPSAELDLLSLRPFLSAGDVIVHSAALAHKSPPAARGRRIAFVSPSYASAQAPCTGRKSSNRECEWEDSLDATTHDLVRLADLGGNNCFPQVHPKAAVLTGPLKISLRRNFRTGPLRRLLSSTLTRWLMCVPGHEAPIATGAEEKEL